MTSNDLAAGLQRIYDAYETVWRDGDDLLIADCIRAIKRYAFVRDNIDWLLSDENGLAGIAFSCQIPLQTIEKATDQELLDAIADAHASGDA